MLRRDRFMHLLKNSLKIFLGFCNEQPWSHILRQVDGQDGIIEQKISQEIVLIDVIVLE